MGPTHTGKRDAFMPPTMGRNLLAAPTPSLHAQRSFLLCLSASLASSNLHASSWSLLRTDVHAQTRAAVPRCVTHLSGLLRCQLEL